MKREILSRCAEKLAIFCMTLVLTVDVITARPQRQASDLPVTYRPSRVGGARFINDPGPPKFNQLHPPPPFQPQVSTQHPHAPFNNILTATVPSVGFPLPPERDAPPKRPLRPGFAKVSVVESATTGPFLAGGNLFTTAPPKLSINFGPGPSTLRPPLPLPPPRTEAPVETSTKKVQLLSDAGKPGSPYELLHRVFPPLTKSRTPEEEEKILNSLQNEDLGGLDPKEVFLSDGDLLIIRGAGFPGTYEETATERPISDYHAPPPMPPPAVEPGTLLYEFQRGESPRPDNNPPPFNGQPSLPFAFPPFPGVGNLPNVSFPGLTLGGPDFFPFPGSNTTVPFMPDGGFRPQINTGAAPPGSNRPPIDSPPGFILQQRPPSFGPPQPGARPDERPGIGSPIIGEVPPPGGRPPPSSNEDYDDEEPPPLFPSRPVEFYYPTHNATEVPPGPAGPGIFVPPPSQFFRPGNNTEYIELLNKLEEAKLFVPPSWESGFQPSEENFDNSLTAERRDGFRQPEFRDLKIDSPNAFKSRGGAAGANEHDIRPLEIFPFSHEFVDDNKASSPPLQSGPNTSQQERLNPFLAGNNPLQSGPNLNPQEQLNPFMGGNDEKLGGGFGERIGGPKLTPGYQSRGFNSQPMARNDPAIIGFPLPANPAFSGRPSEQFRGPKRVGNLDSNRQPVSDQVQMFGNPVVMDNTPFVPGLPPPQRSNTPHAIRRLPSPQPIGAIDRFAPGHSLPDRRVDEGPVEFVENNFKPSLLMNQFRQNLMNQFRQNDFGQNVQPNAEVPSHFVPEGRDMFRDGSPSEKVENTPVLPPSGHQKQSPGKKKKVGTKHDALNIQVSNFPTENLNIEQPARLDEQLVMFPAKQAQRAEDFFRLEQGEKSIKERFPFGLNEQLFPAKQAQRGEDFLRFTQEETPVSFHGFSAFDESEKESFPVQSDGQENFPHNSKTEISSQHDKGEPAIGIFKDSAETIIPEHDLTHVKEIIQPVKTEEKPYNPYYFAQFDSTPSNVNFEKPDYGEHTTVGEKEVQSENVDRISAPNKEQKQADYLSQFEEPNPVPKKEYHTFQTYSYNDDYANFGEKIKKQKIDVAEFSRDKVPPPLPKSTDLPTVLQVETTEPDFFSYSKETELVTPRNPETIGFSPSKLPEEHFSPKEISPTIVTSSPVDPTQIEYTTFGDKVKKVEDASPYVSNYADKQHPDYEVETVNETFLNDFPSQGKDQFSPEVYKPYDEKTSYYQNELKEQVVDHQHKDQVDPTFSEDNKSGITSEPQSKLDGPNVYSEPGYVVTDHEYSSKDSGYKEPLPPLSDGGERPHNSVVSLLGDTDINYRPPLPPVDPDSEIVPLRTLAVSGVEAQTVINYPFTFFHLATHMSPGTVVKFESGPDTKSFVSVSHYGPGGIGYSYSY